MKVLYDNDSYREEFMEAVYELLNDDPTRDRANQIIDLFDGAPVADQPSNDPLTLEELREMDEGTVWVESQEQSKSGWALAGKRNCIHFRAGFSFNDYGKTWLAYRRKPEEGKTI